MASDNLMLSPSIAMMGKGKVSKDRTAKCSQKQTGSQDNDTFMQNEKTKKTKKTKQTRPMTQGLHLAHRVIFFVFLFFFVFFLSCVIFKHFCISFYDCLDMWPYDSQRIAFLSVSSNDGTAQKAHSSDPLFCLEKPIFLHYICSIIDKEHPFQKCNMFETVSTIEERSCASYHRATEYCPVWQKIFL